MKYDYLCQYIPVGIENAIHQKDLAVKLNTTPANAKSIVRRARQEGLQILSGVEGYWIAADETEKLTFVRLMQRQAFSRLRTAKPIRTTLTQAKGQMSFSDAFIAASEEVGTNEQE